MSEGRKVALALGGFYLVAVGVAFGLVRCGSDDGDGGTADEPSSTTITRPERPVVDPPMEYVVRPGDTLSGIAVRFGVTVDAIVDENSLTDPDDLRDGDVLWIPSPPPVWLEVDPLITTLGEIVELTLTGAQPFESVTFEFDSVNGVHVGPPRTASEDGTVSATFRTSIADQPGVYTVTATGTGGTTVQAQFQVDAEER